MAESSRGSQQPDVAEWLRVADSSALAPGQRLHLQLQGRYVSVLRTEASALHCLDSICYHTGGPLTIGDIEDINGELCVKCPWHSYPVRLVDGAKPYQAMKFDPVTRKLTPDGWKYTQNTQRTHEVVDRGPEGPDSGLWVRLSSGGKFESDHFAFNASAAKNVTSGDSSFRPDGNADPSPHGYKRSGEVLAEIRLAKAQPGVQPPAPFMAPPMATTPSAAPMHHAEWRPFRLLSKQRLTPSMWLFRFSLPEKHCFSSWQVERHVRVRLPGQSLVREYTPVSPLQRMGSFDLAIKIYEEGALSPKLAKMLPGQCLEMTGPHGSECTISWSSRTLSSRLGEAGRPFQRLAFLVAGSGVTPCIQILQQWVAQGASCSSLQMDILYANRTEDEIAFLSELKSLAKSFTNVHLCLAVSHPLDTASWSLLGHCGRLDASKLRQELLRPGQLLENTTAVVCGPPEFNESMRLQLTSLGFPHIICF